MSDRRLPGADLRALLRPAIPTTSSPQVLADQLVPALLDSRPGALVIDLGCGRGDSVDAFRAADPGVRWVGVEVSDADFARGDDAELRLFDGVNLPFADASVDVVFCKQVLEHVERPDALVPDVARVLRPGGVFAGSTSHLEPFHARSTANFTPYGLKRLLERSGLDSRRLMAGIDGPTLIARRLSARGALLRPLVEPALAAQHADRRRGRALGWDAEDRNAVKLLFCGHYAFVARR